MARGNFNEGITRFEVKDEKVPLLCHRCGCYGSWIYCRPAGVGSDVGYNQIGRQVSAQNIERFLLQIFYFIGNGGG
jgi:hypothetical protein